MAGSSTSADMAALHLLIVSLLCSLFGEFCCSQPFLNAAPLIDCGVKLALPNAFSLLTFLLLPTCSLRRWSTACCLTQRSNRKTDKHLKSGCEVTKWLYCIDIYTYVHHIFPCEEKAIGDTNETATTTTIIRILKTLCGKFCTGQTD